MSAGLVPPVSEPDPVLVPLPDKGALVYENPDANPGMHALVIGVSEYTYLPKEGNAGSKKALGMSRLESPAISAYRIAQWLVKNHAQLDRPLASVRLLIAPSAKEIEAEPALNGFVTPTLDATTTAAKVWQKDANKSPDGMTFYFFSGHGIRAMNSNSATMLFQDFAHPDQPHFRGAAELQNVVDGMGISSEFKRLPQRQFYFLDACRSTVDTTVLATARSSELLDHTLEEGVKDERSRPVYFATAPGGETYGDAAELSVFASALMAALETGIDNPVPDGAGVRYPITALSLGQRLVECVRERKTGQDCQPAGVQNDAVFRVLTKPPRVTFLVEVVPTAMKSRVQVVDSDEVAHGSFGPSPPDDHPYRVQVPAGIYRIRLYKPPETPTATVQTGSYLIKNGFPPWSVKEP